jgi:predicted  nucleic acid-binding Zn-ribbon protein
VATRSIFETEKFSKGDFAGMAEATLNKKGVLARFRSEAGSHEENADEQQQQLLLLFEKRNELKREFGRTLGELENLREAHAQLTERYEHGRARLEGLERMLADPARAQNAIIYYRLGSLWNHCRELLERRRAELTEKFEQLEKQKALETFKAQAVEQQRQLEQKFSQLDSLYQEMADNLKALHGQLRNSGKLWHYFRRKRLQRDVEIAEEQVAPVVAERDVCLAELERVRDREPPPYKGLSVQAKREVNIQLLALAQYLYIHFSENDFSAMALATREKQPGDSTYGTSQECLAMEKPLREAMSRLRSDDKRNEKLKRRADYLRQTIRFSGNADAVPESQSIARIVLALTSSNQTLDAVRGDVAVNVLEQGYWEVDKLLLKP